MAPHSLPVVPKPAVAAEAEIAKKTLLPTKQHCLRVKKLMQPELLHNRSSIIYMKGNVEKTRDNTDVDLEFRQESYFFYMTGVDEPGFHVIFHLQQEKVCLVVPIVPEDDIFWKGSMPGNSELLSLYDVDQVITETDIPLFLHTVRTELIYVLDHHVDTSHLPPSIPIDYVALSPAVNEARLIKFPWELDIMRRVTYGSSQAHILLMEQCQPGMTEAHLAAVFRWNCALYQIYNQAYLPIVASGPRAATLHYARNNHKIPNSPHTLVLVDAGGENMCYGSDITRTFPASGIFSEEAKTIYSIVLRMQETVLSCLRPGILWADMQRMAIEILCQELVRIGILIGDQEELIELGVPTAFYYHGLGHTVGLEVHDVGGKIMTEDHILSEFLLNRSLQPNMVLTIEPGLYFNETMLQIWTQCPGYQKYFNLDILAQYKCVGGVRIEDTVVITQDGHENLTKVPKQIHEIEQIMNHSKKNIIQ